MRELFPRECRACGAHPIEEHGGFKGFFVIKGVQVVFACGTVVVVHKDGFINVITECSDEEEVNL